MPLVLLASLLLIQGSQEDSQPISYLLDRLGHDHPGVREAASREILQRWRLWTDADLKCMRTAAEGSAATAAEILPLLRRIKEYRTIPEEAWSHCPDVGDIVVAGDAQRISGLIRRIDRLVRNRTLPLRGGLPLLIRFLKDDRPLADSADFRSSDEPVLISKLAHCFIFAAAPWLEGASPQECLRWWLDSKDKPERDWYLPVLNHSNPGVRAQALSYLFLLNDPATYQRAFDALESLKEGHWFSIAVRSAEALPVDTLTQALKRYLRDNRCAARFEVCRLLHRVLPDEVHTSLREALMPPDTRNVHLEDGGDLVGLFNWIAKSGDCNLREMLYKCTQDPRIEWRFAALEPISSIDDPSATRTLLQALSDRESLADAHWSWSLPDVAITNPRVCDMAAIQLSIRAKVARDFKWPESTEHRDTNLEAIKAIWSKRAGEAR